MQLSPRYFYYTLILRPRQPFLTRFVCFMVTTKIARLETTKTRSHKGTKKRKSFEMLGVLSVFVSLW